MHYIHRIVINLDRLEDQSIKEIKREAEGFLEPYYDTVYDYYILFNRTDASTSAEFLKYQDGVLYGRDQPEAFIREIEDAKREQLDYIESLKNYIKGDIDSVIASKITEYKDGMVKSRLELYEIYKITQFLLGHYNSDSGFYDTEDYTAHVDLDKFKANPEKYAIVLANLHN